ncbi:MAG: hypothetical protein U1E53_03820 [Dongiaceae bacterium]
MAHDLSLAVERRLAGRGARLAALLGLALSLSACGPYGTCCYTPADLFAEPYGGYDPGPTHRDR